MASEPPYRGFWINLPDATARATAMAHRVNQLGLTERYQRYEAIDGRTLDAAPPASMSAGAMGLWLTHQRLLTSLQGSSSHIHVLEDDAYLPDGAQGLFDGLLRHADNRLSDWDVIFTEVSVMFDMWTHRAMVRQIEQFRQTSVVMLEDLSQMAFLCASSVFISRKGIGKCLELMTEPAPIDLHLRTMIRAGKLKGYVTVPFLTTITPDADESQIGEPLTTAYRLLNLYRRSLFRDADLAAIGLQMDELARTQPLKPLDELYLKAVGFWIASPVI